MRAVQGSLLGLSVFLGFCMPCYPQHAASDSRWNQKYDFIYSIPAISFHYDHGILAGSCNPGQETTEMRFDDVCNYWGHVCLCGGGGYRIAQMAVEMLEDSQGPLEKGDFILISSRDHTVSDVIAFVVGCTRRYGTEKNQYFIDETIPSPKREYHYHIGYPPQKKAVHIVYRKHLLIGNEQMGRLWRIELAYNQDPATVSPSDLKLYQDGMFTILKEVLTGQSQGLFEVTVAGYNEFVAKLDRLKVRTS